ncbi:TonB-dependent receptor domain-containing protein [Novosphingobium sp.]|uniref:TonB-dependent receptor n=1 Tax=Novosphingobium sp. TaxID=1874826 RepID=UPI00286DF0C2|nr:TonB-dependent receptor [Novosphingobium sp.]
MSLAAIATTLAAAQPAFAQAADETVEEADAGAIVVTARKREEDILSTPVTVQAFTAEKLDAKGVTTMQDLAANTPGLNINDSSSGHADRGFQQVVLRGFTPVTTLATTTSLFIDGVPVSSPSAFTSISSPERIEILKGPQSAYFGRNTFAGAVNVVNREPGNEFHGSGLVSYGTHGNQKYRAEIEGPLLEDILYLRGSFDYFEKKGSWVNAAAGGGTLGDQSSTSGSVTAVFKPVTGLKIKAFMLFSKDDDGAPANGRYVAYDVKNAAGTVILKNSANCSFTGDNRGVLGAAGLVAVVNPYICGTVGTPPNPVSANVTSDASTASFLAIPENRLVRPQNGVQGYGLRRNYHHYHLTGDLDITDQITFSALAGWGTEAWNTMIDLDGFDGSLIAAGSGASVPATSPRGYYDFPFLVERKTTDNSLEARLAYESDSLHMVGGFSYLNATVQSASRGTTGVLTAAGTTPPGGVSQNKTYGIFGGITYDFTDQFSLSAEGRYQTDKLYAYNGATAVTVTVPDLIPVGTYAPRALLASATYKNFMPRVIANFQVTPDMMIYASWAKGVNPAQFNSNLITQTAATQIAAAAAGVKVAVLPEKITNYELGVKGKALDGALRYAVAAYYAQWRDQINSVQLLIPVANASPILTGGVQNAGSVDLKGIEAEIAFRANDYLTIDMAGALNDSNIKQFKSVTLSQLTGIYDYSGKEMPYSSKYSFTFGAQVGHDIESWDNGSWFIRGDLSYKSGTWSGQANTSKSPARTVVNLRAGITKGPFTIEGYVTNLFNDTNITSLIDQTGFDPIGGTFGVRANAALFYNLPDQRTAGVVVKAKF